MSESILSTTRFLDCWATQLQVDKDIAATMASIFSELNEIRLSVSTESWKQFAVTTFRAHPLMDLLLQDPFTRRAFTKPRGYPGDAVTFDFIYTQEDGAPAPSCEEATELGKQVHDYIMQVEGCQAVRARRGVIRQKLHDLAAQRLRPHVLSVGCGHLREAVQCAAFLEGRFGRYVGLDQDTASLAVVARNFGDFGVETIAASVRDLVKGDIALTGFDFVYATGLYDYLPTAVAQKLSAVLFEMLNPGGCLLFANFLPHMSGRGYLEACLDWWLIYRSTSEMLQISEALPERDIESLSLFAEAYQNFLFLEVQRKG